MISLFYPICKFERNVENRGFDDPMERGEMISSNGGRHVEYRSNEPDFNGLLFRSLLCFEQGCRIFLDHRQPVTMTEQDAWV